MPSWNSISAKGRRRRRRRVKVIRAIFKQQLSTAMVLPKVSFGRLVREVMASYSDEVVNVRGAGMLALQCAAEEHLTEMFSEAARLAHYSNRDTITSADLRFVVPGDGRYITPETAADEEAGEDVSLDQEEPDEPEEPEAELASLPHGQALLV
jgi:histone H3/H4